MQNWREYQKRSKRLNYCGKWSWRLGNLLRKCGCSFWTAFWIECVIYDFFRAHLYYNIPEEFLDNVANGRITDQEAKEFLRKKKCFITSMWSNNWRTYQLWEEARQEEFERQRIMESHPLFFRPKKWYDNPYDNQYRRKIWRRMGIVND